MTGEPRCRSLSETLALAVRAARLAGVTRVSDVTAFAVPGIPVMQATRLDARSLSVSQGKGITRTAAIVSALLESVELSAAERLAKPKAQAPLSTLGHDDRAIWSGLRPAQAIDLDPSVERAWLPGVDLVSGRPCRMPWDLLSLDYTLGTLEYPATSVGLASGNSRSEALAAAVAEVIEHHAIAAFELLGPRQRLDAQIALTSIDDPLIDQLLRRIARAKFQVKAWSMANETGLPAILCVLLRSEFSPEDIAPPAGTGCHPDARVAFLRALLEAVQSRAGLVAGARDDVTSEDYGAGSAGEAAVVFGSLAFGDGRLAWQRVPSARWRTSEQCLDFLLGKAAHASTIPIVAYEHEPPVPGLHTVHVLAPGLSHDSRRKDRSPQGSQPSPPSLRSRPRVNARKLLFAGPSIANLAIPAGIEVRPPAKCGDLAALLDDPPEAIALVDGYFKIAPTVWHKEIMALLASGTRVLGGASLGALRAAELERFGMEGVGAIFAAYRSGLVVRDDAVMLDHAPAELGYAALSVPLVDAEHALFLAELPPRALRMMQRIVRTTPFELRTWPLCLDAFRRRTGENFPWLLAALEAAPSLKQMDAKAVIETLASDMGAPAVPDRPMPPITSHFRALLARTAPAFAATLT